MSTPSSLDNQEDNHDQIRTRENLQIWSSVCNWMSPFTHEVQANGNYLPQRSSAALIFKLMVKDAT
uniref:Uncharacterized protein n=1 Tax=Arundo donax TaxID=35708 RepID=A0A0A9A8H2_ARUDO